MTDVLAIIEQTEPRVLPEARSFVLTTLDDDVSQQCREWPIETLRHWMRKDWRVEVHPNWSSD